MHTAQQPYFDVDDRETYWIYTNLHRMYITRYIEPCALVQYWLTPSSYRIAPAYEIDVLVDADHIILSSICHSPNLNRSCSNLSVSRSINPHSELLLFTMRISSSHAHVCYLRTYTHASAITRQVSIPSQLRALQL